MSRSKSIIDRMLKEMADSLYDGLNEFIEPYEAEISDLHEQIVALRAAIQELEAEIDELESELK